MRAKLASANERKLDELRPALPGWEIELLAATSFPDEAGETYYDNARTKAGFGRTISDHGFWVLGEDSGLEIAALGGRPGITSARWATDPVARALEELEGIPDRAARYVCELVCISPQLEEYRGTGTLEGRVAEEPRGTEGFGYDPIFIPDGQVLTVAELGNAWKASNSHRARAAAALTAALRQSRDI